MTEQAKRQLQRPGRTAVLLFALAGVLLAASLAYGDPAQVRGSEDVAGGEGRAMSLTGPPAPPADQPSRGAPPAPPSSLYGYVTLNGGRVLEGTVITATIGTVAVAAAETTMYQGASFYALDVPADDPGTKEVEGGRPGDTVTFTVAGLPAEQTARWQGGTNRPLDLAVNSPWPRAVYLPRVFGAGVAGQPGR